ncbi:MAG: asparagine synthase (glutamine-hydrolyzing) [Bacteroidota bacterium]
MCGICGIIDPAGRLAEAQKRETVARMNQALYHRGPDGEGNYASATAALAMRRLAIIDLGGGQQPIYNESGRIGVFLNGEIYNYRELRQQLRRSGHVFRTDCDTEVLVHLYEEHGTGMCALLRGMFSFCLYDLDADFFLLARDRFGEKPLYYHWDRGVLSFASEIRALLEYEGLDRRLRPEALPYYFRTSLVPEPLTLLRGVDTLLPGHYLTIERGKQTTAPYFELTYPEAMDFASEAAASEFIRPHLEKAVARQTVSDVPLGAFLSGGIDSSTVVALLQKQSSQRIKTFNVRFEEEAFDESPIARKVAEFWDTDHHEIVIPNRDFEEDIFWKIIDHVGLPFRDSSAIPTFQISREIRRHVTVALSGDGGDELFGGYQLFQWHDKILKLKEWARPLRLAGQRSLALAQQLPVVNKVSMLRKVQRAINTSLEERDAIPIALNEFYPLAEVRDLLEQQAFSSGLDFNLTALKRYPAGAENWSALRRIMYYRAVHTLPANMLVKVDRMSMANSLEVRAPFLDPDLFDAAAQLPDRLLIRGGKGKYLLRQIMAADLPPEVFNHPKQGFGIPLYKYQNQAFQQLAQRLLFEENPWPGLFPQALLRKYYDRGLQHQNDSARLSTFQSAHQLWMLMQLLGWAQRFNVQAN